MFADPRFRVEATALISILVLIPLYMGIIHVSAWGAGIYALLGGTAITFGDNAQYGLQEMRVTFPELALWTSAVVGIGGVVYVLALAFL